MVCGISGQNQYRPGGASGFGGGSGGIGGVSGDGSGGSFNSPAGGRPGGTSSSGGGFGGDAGYTEGGNGDAGGSLEETIPGVPGDDYPIFSEVPESSFICDGQVDGGYYADPETDFWDKHFFGLLRFSYFQGYCN